MKNLLTKKMGVKFLAVALSAAMITVTGCGSKTQTTPDKEVPAAQSQQVVESTEKQSEEAAPVEEKEEAKSEDMETSETEDTSEAADEEETETEADGEDDEEAEEEYEYTERPSKTNSKLLNGNFANDLDYFDLYAVAPGEMTYSINKGVLAVDVFDTGTEEWHVQLKQSGIRLEQGKWYKITLSAKSSLARTIGCAMQRDGSNDNNWITYSNTERFDLTGQWQTYTVLFQMNEKTDRDANFNLSLGAIDGKKITKDHTVSIKNITMTQLADNWMDALKIDDNLIVNPSFIHENIAWDGAVNGTAAAKVSYKNNKAVFDIAKPGDLDWHVQLKQGGIKLEQGYGYRLNFKVSSTVARTIKIGFMDTEYINWYGGGDVKVGPDETMVDIKLFMTHPTNENVLFMLSMGKIEGEDTPASVITLKDITFRKDSSVSLYGGGVSGGGGSNPFTTLTNGWGVYDHEDKHAGLCCVDGSNGYRIDINNTGSEEWHVQLQKKGVTLEKGKYYKVSFEAKSTVDRVIGYMLQRDGSADNNWITYNKTDGTDKPALTSEWQSFGQTFKMSSNTDTNTSFNFSLGYVNNTAVEKSHTVWIKNIKLEEVEAPDNGGVIAEIHATDNQVSDDGVNYCWKKTFNPAEFLDDYKSGDKIKVTAKLASDGTFSGFLGMCMHPDYSAWINSDVKEVPANTDSVWELTVDDSMGDIQVQIFSIGGNTVTIKEFAVEKVTDDGNKDDSKVAEVFVTDKKESGDGVNFNWIKRFNPADFAKDYKEGDTIKVTAKMESDGFFCGVIGMCQTPNWSRWTSSSQFDVNGGEEGIWEYTIEDSMGDIQFQIYYIGGTSVVFKELTVEVVKPEGSNTGDAGNKEPIYKGTVNKANGNQGFNFGKYVPDMKAGDTVAVTVKFSSTMNSWGGAVGGTNGEEPWWKAVEYSNENPQVTLELLIGYDESGNLKDYTEMQAWWPEEGDISFEVLSVEKK